MYDVVVVLSYLGMVLVPLVYLSKDRVCAFESRENAGGRKSR